ncbi:MAG: ribosome silencing factor [Candidatus Fermentibacter daniensis]|nr:ribosome silencing factor [Candidatus Fermentibacter daniensis]
MVAAIHERHGYRVRAIDMSGFPLTMDMFLVASASSATQARAVADRVEEVARSMGVRLHHKEGFEDGNWILLDFDNLVVHVFQPDAREYYNLEMLWSDADFEDFPDQQPEASIET